MHNSPNQHNRKTLHFSSNDQVFNYTGDQNSHEDSLLITPRDRRQQEPVGRFELPPQLHLEAIESEQVQVQKEKINETKNIVKARREAFMKKLAEKAAQINPELPEQNLQRVEPRRSEDHQQQMMDIEQNEKPQTSPERSKADSIKEQPNQQNLQKSINRYGRLSEEANRKIASLSSETKDKVNRLNQIRTSQKKNHFDQDHQDGVHNSHRGKKDARRVTMDLKTLFCQKSSRGKESPKKYSDMIIEDEEGMQSNEKQKGSIIKRNSIGEPDTVRYVNKVSKRMSGKSVPDRSRVTVGMDDLIEVLLAEKNKMTQNMKTFDNLKDKIENKKEEEQIVRQDRQNKIFLQKYFDDAPVRERQLDEEMKKVDEQLVQLELTIKQLQYTNRNIEEETNKYRHQRDEIKQQKNRYQHKIPTEQETKLAMAPLYYLQEKYGIQIIRFDSEDNPQPYISYHLDFVLDHQILCRFQKNHQHSAQGCVKESTSLRIKEPEWIIESDVRVQILNKFVSENISNYSPMDMLIRFGELYKRIQNIDSDIRLIEQFFGTNDFIYEPLLNQLSFFMPNVLTDVSIEVHLNFMTFPNPSFLQIHAKSTSQREKESLIFKHNGIKKSLLPFIEDCLQIFTNS